MGAFTDIYLRKAEQEDMDLLFQWVNDPDVRRNAFHTANIPYENHVAWFYRMMEDAAVRQYILCQGDERVGQIRLNLEGNTALIDYSIAPALRGQGLGSHMLALVKEKVQKDAATVTRIVGQVKYENTASAHVFEKCGYHKIVKKDYIEYQFIL